MSCTPSLPCAVIGWCVSLITILVVAQKHLPSCAHPLCRSRVLTADVQISNVVNGKPENPDGDCTHISSEDEGFSCREMSAEAQDLMKIPTVHIGWGAVYSVLCFQGGQGFISYFKPVFKCGSDSGVPARCVELLVAAHALNLCIWSLSAIQFSRNTHREAVRTLAHT